MHSHVLEWDRLILTIFRITRSLFVLRFWLLLGIFRDSVVKETAHVLIRFCDDDVTLSIQQAQGVRIRLQVRALKLRARPESIAALGCTSSQTCIFVLAHFRLSPTLRLVPHGASGRNFYIANFR